jgi:UDP-N-acetylglucosamine 2-epimerase
VKALVVAGARPNFVKIAPLLQALRGAGHHAELVHTGQHYERHDVGLVLSRTSVFLRPIIGSGWDRVRGPSRSRA